MKKWNLSIGALLRNRKIMLLVSFGIAIVLWVSVLSGPANIQDRTLTLPVSVDLSNTYAEQIGLRLSEEVNTEVTVVVQGQFSVISRLSASDLRVRANVSSIQKAGRQEVRLTVDYNSELVNYDIVSVYPDVVTVTCDYWETETFKVQVDTSTLSVDEESGRQLGTPILDPTVTQDGSLTWSGPKSVLDRITTLTARIGTTVELADVRVFEAALVATDENGAVVDLSRCTVSGLTNHNINVTVPVWVTRVVPLTYTLQNAPADFDAASRITLSETEVTLLGSADMLDRLTDLGDLGVLDFDTLTPETAVREFTLDLPDSVQVVSGETAVTLTVDLSGYSVRTLTFTPSSSNVVYTNNTTGKTPSVQQRSLTVTLVGNGRAFLDITAADLQLVVDMTGATAGRADPYPARLRIADNDAAWVYYGDTASGTSVYVTLN